MIKFLYKLIFLFILFNVAHASSYTAKSWVVTDEQGNIIDGSNITEVRSIASITKLMTVIVVLDANQDLEEIITTKYLDKPLSKLSRRNLISLALVHSDNHAALLLCQNYPGGYNSCIDAMNEKAIASHMINTKFVDPTGRYNDNVSTTEDLIKLVKVASTYPLIIENSNKEKITFQTAKKKNKPEFNNTNKLIKEGYYFLVSKTGFIRRAGGCIAMMVQTTKGIRIVIVLGSKNMKTRINEAKQLVNLY